MHKQCEYYMNDKLSSLLTGFRKNSKAQHCLITMLKMEKQTGKIEIYRVMLMDLWNASDSINHNLLVAKLELYGFSAILNLARSYRKNHKQRVNVNSNFSILEMILAFPKTPP